MQLLQQPKPPFILSSDLAEAYREVKRLGNMFVDGGESGDFIGGRTVRIPERQLRFPARVWASAFSSGASGGGMGSSGSPTSSGSGMGAAFAYDWREQRCLPGGRFEDDPTGRHGSYLTFNAAYEMNVLIAPNDSIVWLSPGATYLETLPLSGGASGGASGSGGIAIQVLVEEWIFQYEGRRRGSGSGSGGSGNPNCLTGTMTCPDGSTSTFTLCLPG